MTTTKRIQRGLILGLALTLVVGPAHLDALGRCDAREPARQDPQALGTFFGESPVLRAQDHRFTHKRLQRGNPEEYTFVGNNPATLRDPSGTIVWAPIIWGLAKLGGIALAGAGVGVGLNAVEQYGNTGSFTWNQSTTYDAAGGALMAIPGFGLVRGAQMGYRAAAFGVRAFGGLGVAGGGYHFAGGLASGQYGTATRGAIEAGLGGLGLFARFRPGTAADDVYGLRLTTHSRRSRER